jgi:hypothetical protein
MAWNNRPATDTIPFLSPFLAPSARALGPLLSQLASPGPLRATVEGAADALRGLSPSLVRQVMPMIDQLTPILMDVAQVGRACLVRWLQRAAGGWGAPGWALS